MKVAIIHYWFLLNGGGEQVIRSLLRIFPDADLFCLFADPKSLPQEISPSRVTLSLLDRLPFSHRLNRVLFPLYPAAVGAFDFSGYDLILSSDYAPAKAIVPPVDTPHVSYLHAPGRHIWDQSSSFARSLPRLARPIYYKLAASARESDFIGAQRIDYIIANAQHIARRIQKYYRRESVVIYPPVRAADAQIANKPGDYYLCVGRMTELKRDDVIISACNKLGRRLLVAGTGREEKPLRAMAGPTVEFLGRVNDATLRQLYAECRALLFAANEDFGIVPVEAQAHGRPVIAFGKGGALETIRVNDNEGRPDTGVFFHEQSCDSLMRAIEEFERIEHRFDPIAIREHALQFDEAVFHSSMQSFIREAMSEFSARPPYRLIQEVPKQFSSSRIGLPGLK